MEKQTAEKVVAEKQEQEIKHLVALVSELPTQEVRMLKQEDGTILHFVTFVEKLQELDERVSKLEK